MASTRHPAVLNIFQDPDTNYDDDAIAQSAHFSHQPSSSPFNTMPTLSHSDSLIFGPPLPEQNGYSPLKQANPSSSPPRVVLGDKSNISLPPPPVSLFATDSPTKRRVTSTYQPIAPHKSAQPLFSMFPTNAALNKENAQSSYHSDNFAEFPGSSYGTKIQGKRTFLDAATVQDRPQKKARMSDPSTCQLPDPQDMPPIDDDGSKPPYSYAALIGMSILRAPNRRLTLAQIYKWISNTFSYYRASETGWQNSIRHNLSLNKAFIKQERPKDDPGKGNYWAIEAGMESTFIKEKTSRRPASSSGPSMKVHSQQTSEMSLSSSAPVPPLPTFKAAANNSENQEPSSDATIPDSDPALLGDFDEIINMPPPASRTLLSSPLQAIRSSPPVASRVSREATPAYPSDFTSSANLSKTRKRKFSTMNDSGYYSSIESSAQRPTFQTNPDTIAPRFKRGRAEEEIARIRSSSHDISPSKGRALLQQLTPRLMSSSPLRYHENALMLPPLTPATKFKMLPKPPTSISPNTNLRNHRDRIRELVGSPIKGFSMDNEFSYSPSFNIIDEEQFLFHDALNNGFSIYRDSPKVGHAFASPEKRSVKRPQHYRSNTTTGILADVTGNGGSKKAAVPNLNPAFQESTLKQKSPSKSPAFKNPIIEPSKDSFFSMDFLPADDDSDDFGFDLLQGFQKIGEKENIIRGNMSKGSNRPPLGSRSNLSHF